MCFIIFSISPQNSNFKLDFWFFLVVFFFSFFGFNLISFFPLIDSCIPFLLVFNGILFWTVPALKVLDKSFLSEIPLKLLFKFSSTSISRGTYNLNKIQCLYIVFFVFENIPLNPFFWFSFSISSNMGKIIFSKNSLYFNSSLFFKNIRPYPSKSFKLFCISLWVFSEVIIFTLHKIQNIKNCSNLFSMNSFSPESPVVSYAIHNKIIFKLNIFILSSSFLWFLLLSFELLSLNKFSKIFLYILFPPYSINKSLKISKVFPS